MFGFDMLVSVYLHGVCMILAIITSS